MSWSIHVETDKDVSEADIDVIVAGMPDWMTTKGHGAWFKGSKQQWGWSLAVDVHKPEPNGCSTPRSIWCGGSCSISGQVAERFCEEFARMIAARLGCKATPTPMSV